MTKPTTLSSQPTLRIFWMRRGRTVSVEVVAATLNTTGTIPVASIALILGIHRILAEGLTFVNLIGNALATVVIAKWEGKLDERTLAAMIGNARLRAKYPVAA